MFWRKTLGVLVQNTQTKTLKHLQITNVLFENAGILVCNTFKMRNVFPGIYSVSKQILDVHPRSDSTELAEAVPIV